MSTFTLRTVRCLHFPFFFREAFFSSCSSSPRTKLFSEAICFFTESHISRNFFFLKKEGVGPPATPLWFVFFLWQKRKQILIKSGDLHNCGNTTEATTLQQFINKKKKSKIQDCQKKAATLIQQTGILLSHHIWEESDTAKAHHFKVAPKKRAYCS